ncbi:SAM-dependent methyltransferase, partial [Thermovenabulum sp.]
YSTFIYLFEEIKALGVEVSIIPGVPSFSAVFSLLKIPFARKGQAVLVADKWFNNDEVVNTDRVLLLKGSGNKEAIFALKKMGYEVYYAKRIFMEGEGIYTREEDIMNDADYFSMIIGVRG